MWQGARRWKTNEEECGNGTVSVSGHRERDEIMDAPARRNPSALSKAISRSPYTPAFAPAWIIANSPET